MNSAVIDLNADLGEGSGYDSEIIPWVTSCNVCCGAYAGDETTIRETLQLAQRQGLVIGAHPGYADREHFGRREQMLPLVELKQLVRDQVQWLQAIAAPLGIQIRYIKPHGALYNQVMHTSDMALALVEICQELDELPIVGLPGSLLESVCAKVGLHFIAEGYLDRRYQPDGSLVPRTEANAMITDPVEAVAQLQKLMGRVDTLCVHGDTPQALEFVQKVRQHLQEHHIRCQPVL